MSKKVDLKIKNEEWLGVILSFIYFFSVLAAYYVIRPIREELSAAEGSEKLPWFFAATFFVTLFLTPIFGWLASRWPRHILMPAVYGFFIVCQLAFVPFFLYPQLIPLEILGITFFVWVSVFNLFVVSVFWSFMTDIWNDEQARRLFPIIALGGTAGAILGPILTRTLVETIGIGSLLIVSAAFLLVAVICTVFLGKWANQYGTHRLQLNAEAPVGGGMFDGLKQIFLNPFVGTMALLMVMGDAIGTIAYVLVIDYSGATFHDAIERTRFAANIDIITNILQVIVQLTFTRWLLVKSGAGPVIACWAVISIITCLGMSLAYNPYAPVIGSMPWVALVIIITRSLAHAMVQPARETLFTLVPREVRYKGKNAIDTAVWRAGDVASSLSINTLRALGVSVSGFGFIGIALIAISGTIGWSLANRVERGEFKD